MEVEGGCGVSEVENRRKRGEERCVELELEIVKRKSEYEALEAKYRALEREKVAMEEEIRVLKRGRGEVKEQGNGGGDEKETLEVSVGLDEDNVDEDGVFELMVENETLEIEKKNAESEVEAWRRKFKELERWVLNLDKDLVLKSGEFMLKLSGGSLGVSKGTEGNERMELEDGLKIGVGMGSSRSRDIGVNVVDLSSTYQSPGIGSCHLQAADTPPTTLNEHRDGDKEIMRSGMDYGHVSQARKQLEFKADRSPCKKMAPPTPGGGIPKPHSVIDISDSDDELTIAHNQIVLPTDNKESRKIPPIKSFSDQENVDAFNEEVLAFSTPKRKRASNVVDSDSESSDDNIPIAVKKMHLLETKRDGVGSDVTGNLETASVVDDVSVTSPKRRLVRLTKCDGKSQAQRSSSQTSETKIDREPEEDEPEEVGSDSEGSEGESLGGFIVNSSDDSESNDASSESNNVSDDDVDFEEVLSAIRRNKDHDTKWEFEADMLAAFAKDPELCMKAVCALYRQQSSEEQAHKETFLTNSRGFSKFDALRGSKLAEFLTDGDPNGDLKKTVKELEERDPMAIEMCRDLANRYSKQLFEIYKNKEDPLFLPS